ncbi:MAG: hypothetical protein SFX72_02970 [Isosphaeraceae bacterium]|nr:hypothetical protein [Isosphaeraceae bacterium]
MPRRSTDRVGRRLRHRSPRLSVEALDARVLLSIDAAGPIPIARSAAGVLEVLGTPRADRIRILPTEVAGELRVVADGRELGRFGSISRIDVFAGAGDDLIVVNPRITLSARIDAGDGHDVVRGGSGHNAILAGRGNDTIHFRPDRDTFDEGPGRDRLVRHDDLGVVQVAAGVSGPGLRRLSGSHRIVDLRFVGHTVIAASDLRDARTVELIKASYAGGHTVALARARVADAEALARLLGDPRPVNLPNGLPRADLVAFRKSAAGGLPTFEISTLVPVFDRLPTQTAVRAARATDREYLGRVFSPVHQVKGRQAFGDPSDDLTALASAYVSTIKYDGNTGTTQIVTTVYSARSFSQQSDYYYVLQETQTVGWGGDLGQVGTGGHIRAAGTPPKYGLKAYPTVLQPTPVENPQTVSYTTSVSENFGATVGWNEDSGFNATIGGGVSLEQSQTYTVPPIQILYDPNILAGTTNWIFVSNNGVLDQLTVNNSWIWIVDFDDYETGQTILPFETYACIGPANAPEDYTVIDLASAPVPFGDVFQLASPVVAGVDTPTVVPGNKFTISGSAFYPSLVESLLINGQVLDASSYTVVSDTQIEVVAPNTPGNDLPIVVKTSQGLSNANVTIDIAGANDTITVQTTPVSAVAGQAFSNVTVATVTDSNTNIGAAGLSATITWGDGSTSPGVLTATGPGAFTVSGGHTYSTAGSYTFNVEVTETGGSRGSASGSATVTPPSNASGVQNLVALPISGVAGQAITNATIATFTDSDFGVLPSDFTAAVDWGDGILTPSTTVIATAGGFAVLGSHLYNQLGFYDFRIQITDGQGNKSLVAGKATITSNSLRRTPTA